MFIFISDRKPAAVGVQGNYRTMQPRKNMQWVIRFVLKIAAK